MGRWKDMIVLTGRKPIENEGDEMTFKELASRLAKAEGKKHQASVGDVRELLSKLAQMIKDDPITVLQTLQVAAARKKASKK